MQPIINCSFFNKQCAHQLKFYIFIILSSNNLKNDSQLRPLILIICLCSIIIMSYELQATIDIAFKIQNFRNISELYIRDLYFVLSVSAGDNQASPYQIITKTNSTKSNINLLEYISPLLTLGPYAQVKLQELVVFKLLVPVGELQTLKLCYSLRLLQIVDSISKETTEIDVIQIEHITLLWIGSFVPLYLSNSRCAVDAAVDTQLLACRGKDISSAPKSTLYSAINSQMISYNRLREKMNVSLQQQEIGSIEMQKYPEYEQVKTSMQSRIFHSKPQQELREMVIKLAGRFLPNINKKIQRIWNKYLRLILEKDVNEHKNNFLKSFNLQIRSHVYHNEYIRQQEQQHFQVESIKIGSLPIKIYPIFKQEAKNYQKGEEIADNHFVFIAHGFGATTLATLPIQLTLRFLYPHLRVTNSRINQNKTEDNLFEIGRRLASQVQMVIQQADCKDNFSISFIAHSMGGLVVRAALTFLQQYRLNMRNYISLGTPHLGYMYHNSSINKFGMWAYSKLKDSLSMKTLLMYNEDGDLRLSYLYELSTLSGLNWFQEVIFYACNTDKFVSPESALCITKDQILQEQAKGVQSAIVWQQMRKNIDRLLQNIGVSKFQVDFSRENEGNESSLADEWFGRRDHMNLCSSQSFINCLLISNQHLFLDSAQSS